MNRANWLHMLEEFLEARREDAPDEACELLAKDLWETTREFTQDEGEVP